MINVGTLSKLRRMVRRDGLSVREASKKLGIARNTAARWLAMEEPTWAKVKNWSQRARKH